MIMAISFIFSFIPDKIDANTRTGPCFLGHSGFTVQEPVMDLQNLVHGGLDSL